jgi:hypothetical protein
LRQCSSRGRKFWRLELKQGSGLGRRSGECRRVRAEESGCLAVEWDEAVVWSLVRCVDSNGGRVWLSVWFV